MKRRSILLLVAMLVGCAGGAESSDATIADGGSSDAPADAPEGADGDPNGCLVGMIRSCYPGDPAQVGVGTCRAGTQRCVGPGEFGTWGLCENAIMAQAEVCGDSLDNDCNNDVDNGCPCTYSRSTGVAYSGASVCCESTSMLASIADCGSGNNHWVTRSGLCGVCYEGSGNYGSPCVSIVCSGALLMGTCR